MPAMEQNDTGDSVTLGVGSDAGGETQGRALPCRPSSRAWELPCTGPCGEATCTGTGKKKHTTVHQSEAALHPKPCQMEKSPKSVWLEVTVVRKEATN